MKINRNQISLWATIIGLVLAVAGLLKEKAVLLYLGIIVFILFLVACYFLQKEKIKIKSSSIVVEGKSIDCLNIANLSRLQNKSLLVQDVTHVATIQGNDLKIEMHYNGYCKSKKGANGIEFSIDADANLPFDELDCYGYDLINDPNMSQKIKPIPHSPDSISKKIQLPFSNIIKRNEKFEVVLHATLNNCMQYGKDYYVSTLSFRQESIHNYIVKLEFMYDKPVWLRVYDVNTSGSANLVKNLTPISEPNSTTYKYEDHIGQVPAKSNRIYLFFREDS